MKNHLRTHFCLDEFHEEVAKNLFCLVEVHEEVAKSLFL